MSGEAFQVSGESSSETLRILMADDDPQEHILMMMTAEGLSTSLIFDFVPDGSKLLTELYIPTRVDQLPNLIILDLRMPRLDGYRTLEELQAHPIFWQIPVVVFTSSARVEDQALSYARGAVLFQTKPSSFAGMEEFLKRAITIAKPATEYEEIEEFEQVDGIINITDVVDINKVEKQARQTDSRSDRSHQ